MLWVPEKKSHFWGNAIKKQQHVYKQNYKNLSLNYLRYSSFPVLYQEMVSVTFNLKVAV